MIKNIKSANHLETDSLRKAVVFFACLSFLLCKEITIICTRNLSRCNTYEGNERLPLVMCFAFEYDFSYDFWCFGAEMVVIVIKNGISLIYVSTTCILSTAPMPWGRTWSIWRLTEKKLSTCESKKKTLKKTQRRVCGTWMMMTMREAKRQSERMIMIICVRRRVEYDTE